MHKFKLNQTLLLMLITAFLSMQLTTAHIHLAQHHDHDNSHHQHNIEVHTHHSIDHQAEFINSSHHSHDTNVVELDHEFNGQKVEKSEKPSASFIALTFPQSSLISNISAKLPDVINTKFSYLNRATVSPRAPPIYS